MTDEKKISGPGNIGTVAENAADNAKVPLLSVRNLTVSFNRYDRGFDKYDLEVIHSLDVEVYPGEVIAVVGASGSGKSLLAHSVLGILPENAAVTGKMEYMGQPLTAELQRKLRGRDMVLIPQSVEFLDPLMKVGEQVKGVRGTMEKVRSVFKRYELPDKTEGMYPFQLSGGMARRVLISTAVMEEAKLIIADEPTPGLGVDMAMETLRHFRKLADDGCGVLLITHDIDLAFGIADRIAVFYAGTTVEVCSAEDFRKGKDALRHPYSKAFIDALPQNDFKPIAGTQPYAGALPKGCLFADRCPLRTEECSGSIEMKELRGGKVRCIHAT
ncbi:MAG TPA: ABC transporter ATP-binding protein [Candidatus Copromorpha excrementipullorum]|uniref:Nickel import system ATP-binding protein NikD n=1 Tax=Candidatus Allocopromorpha excrementipullorum TaxID=2840743 RepID=A0A9D1N6I6_9FIRM|nr:ABC transporter ATP-binding protein [Candidatus Copromorpha excrementipullorum]